MTKTTINERVRRAADGFFRNEPESSSRSGQMTYTGEATMRAAGSESVVEAADRWIGALRSIFLFLPGTFALYYLTLATAEFWVDMDPGLLEILGISLWYLATGFMVYAGVGKLTQVRNLAIPVVVVAMALALVIAAQVLPVDRTEMYFWYSIYVFPLVLVAAKLVQGRIGGR